MIATIMINIKKNKCKFTHPWQGKTGNVPPETDLKIPEELFSNGRTLSISFKLLKHVWTGWFKMICFISRT